MMGLNITPMVKNLLILNIGIFAITDFVAPQLYGLFAVQYFESDYFAPWQLFTYMFMHADWMHVFGNMLLLFLTGSYVENALGSNRFLALYIISGIGAVILNQGIIFAEITPIKQAAQTYLYDPTYENILVFERKVGTEIFTTEYLNQYKANPENDYLVIEGKEAVKGILARIKNSIGMVGASGAVFGVLFAFGWIFAEMTIMLLIPPIPVRVKYLVAVYALLEFYAGVRPLQNDTVAHFAHLGGMLFAFIIIKYWRIPYNNQY